MDDEESERLQRFTRRNENRARMEEEKKVEMIRRILHSGLVSRFAHVKYAAEISLFIYKTSSSINFRLTF